MKKITKRTPAQMEKVCARLLAYVKKHPGQTMEQITRGMRTTTKLLMRPVKNLGRKLRSRGVTRATVYFAR